MRVLLLFVALLLLIDLVDCESSSVSVLRGRRNDASTEPRLLKKDDDDDKDKESEDTSQDNNNDNNNDNNETPGEGGTTDPGFGTGIEDCPSYCAANPQIEDCEKECEKANEKAEEGGANLVVFNTFMRKCNKKIKKKCRVIIDGLAPGAKTPKRCRSFPNFGPTCLKKWQKQGN